MDKYRKRFFNKIDTRITRQITPSAFISPPGALIISYSSALNLLMGFNFAKNELGLEAMISVSSFLKMSSKNGLSKAREITENSDDKILKLK